MPKSTDLDSAYALETPQDNQALYADWADSYDATFAQDMDYQMPAHVAGFLLKLPMLEPVLDVGAGTGLVAEALLSTRKCVVDALDISPQMLAVAAEKGLYRRTIEGDLTQRLPIPDSTYSAVVSSGTFTHGHVGPDALDELLRVAKSGAQFVIGVNAEHWEARGFADKFGQLAPHIRNFEIATVSIYGTGATGGHKDDAGHVAMFCKA